MKDDPSDAELREKLAAWQIRVHVPDDFQQRVWKRIAAREAADADPALSNWRKILSSFALRVSIPRLAVTSLALSLVVGTTTGVVEASRWNASTWNRLEAKYVQSIDPYQRIASF